MMLPLWALNILGWLKSHWRYVAYAIAGIVLFILIVSFARSCGKKAPKINEADVQTAKQAIAVNDTAVMKEVLVKSDVQEKVADGIIANSSVESIKATQESRAKWDSATDEQIRAEAERRVNQ